MRYSIFSAALMAWFLAGARAAAEAPFTITTVFSPSSVQVTQGMVAPGGLAVDAGGNIYIADTMAQRIWRRDSSGTVTPVAGNGQFGYSGDGGAAVSAQLNLPTAVAIAPDGSLYVADTQNYRIRRISPAGNITTVAGNGYHDGTECSGSVIPATQVPVDPAYGLAFDLAGNLYFGHNGAVRRLDSAGMLHTVMGCGTGPNLSAPSGVAFDAAGNLYIADLMDIYKRAPDGTVVKLVHSTTMMGSYSLAYHPSRGVCYPNSYQIFCIGSSGSPAAVAGTGIAGLGGDGGPAYLAQIGYVTGVAFDSAGNLYIGDSENHRVRQVTPSGIISTVAKGPVTASVQLSKHVAADGAGNLYISDEISNVVWRRAQDGSISVVAGTGVRGVGGDGVAATESTIFAPAGVATDTSGNLYIVETGMGAMRVRKVTPDGIIHTIAGTGTMGYSGDNGPAASAQFNNPTDVAADAAGNVYVADSGNNRIRQIRPDGTIRTVAGNGMAGSSTQSTVDGSAAVSAPIGNPQALAVSPAGDVYVGAGGLVWRFRPGGNISRVAGNGGCGTGGDGGPAVAAPICFVAGLAIDTSGNLYVSDQGNQRVRRVDSAGIITTYAGNGNTGYSGDGGPAVQARFNTPWGVAADASGGLYIADVGNKSARYVFAGTGCPIFTSTSGRVIDAAAASGSFSVSSPATCSYAASAGVSWIHVTGGAAGQGNGTVQYAIDSNNGAASRSGALMIAGAGTNVMVYFHQSGAACQMSLNSALISEPATAGFGVEPIDQNPSGCAAWQATSDSGWLTITNGPWYAGAPSVLFTFDNNPGLQQRTARVTIGNQILTVNQAGSPVSMLSPTNGSKLNPGSATFTWNTWQGTEFRFALGYQPGASDLASGSTAGGSASISGIPRNGRPLYWSLWYALGTTWEPAPIQANYVAPPSGDQDGNGVPDLVWQADSSRVVTVNYYAGAGGAEFSGWNWLYSAGVPGWHIAGAADFDGNGVPDPVWQNDATGQVTVNYFGGTGGATLLGWAWLNGNNNAGWKVVGIGDFDANGVPDLVWQQDSTRQVTINYYSRINGVPTMTGWAWLKSDNTPGWHVAAVADFDLNGVPDLVWINDTNGQATVNYYGGAQGSAFTGWAWLNSNDNTGWTVVGANDFDGNGVPDLVWQKASSRQVTVNYYQLTGGSPQLTGWAWLQAGSVPGWTAIVPR